MMRLITLSLLLAVCLAGCGQQPADQEEKVVNKQVDQEEKAVNAIRKLGGKVERGKNLPGWPVTGIDLTGTYMTDAGLKELKEFKNLQSLDLIGTKITDAGLKELKELKDLQSLDLGCTKITDAGLKELKELKGLQFLNLQDTNITDAGLKEMKELKGLHVLNLMGTKITDAGLEDLRHALPNTGIRGPHERVGTPAGFLTPHPR